MAESGFSWFVRETCGRLNAVQQTGWYSQGYSLENVDRNLQGLQTQLRDHIWCGPGFDGPLAFVVVPDGTTSRSPDVPVFYRVQKKDDGKFCLEFRVDPLPAGNVALYFASDDSSHRSGLKKQARDGPGRCVIDPSNWAGRLVRLSWTSLNGPFGTQLSVSIPLRITDEKLVGGKCKLGEDHLCEFKMPQPLVMGTDFANKHMVEIGPLANALCDISQSSVLWLGIGDGKTGLKGYIIGAEIVDITKLKLPDLFPPLKQEEIRADQVEVVARSLDWQKVYQVSDRDHGRQVIVNCQGSAWLVENPSEECFGIVLDRAIDGLPTCLKGLAVTENERLDKSKWILIKRHVIRISINITDPARLRVHVADSRVGNINLEGRSLPLNPLGAWLRLQTIQPDMQAWFASGLTLKFGVYPNGLSMEQMLGSPLPSCETLITSRVLAEKSVSVRLLIIHLSSWDVLLAYVIQTDIAHFKTKWKAVVIVPLNSEIYALCQSICGMRDAGVDVICVLPCGIQQQSVLPHSPLIWKNQWTPQGFAMKFGEPIICDPNLQHDLDHIREISRAWIISDRDARQSGPPPWELVRDGFVVETTSSRNLEQVLTGDRVGTSVVTCIATFSENALYAEAGVTCCLRRVAWNLDKAQKGIVLWVRDASAFSIEVKNLLLRLSKGSSTRCFLFCDADPSVLYKLLNEASSDFGDRNLIIVHSAIESSISASASRTILISPIWEISDLENLARHLNTFNFGLVNRSDTRLALEDARRYALANPGDHLARHYFIFVLAAARGRFRRAWDWVHENRLTMESLSNSLALLRVSLPSENDGYVIPISQDEASKIPPTWTTRAGQDHSKLWVAYVHPILAMLHLHQLELNVYPCDGRDLVKAFPSPTCLASVWERTAEFLNQSHLPREKVSTIVRDVLQTRGHRTFSTFTFQFLRDPERFPTCLNFPPTPEMRVREPHASVLISRVFRHANLLSESLAYAERALQVALGLQDDSLISLASDNRISCWIAFIEIGYHDFVPWCESELGFIIGKCEDEQDDYLQLERLIGYRNRLNRCLTGHDSYGEPIQ